MTKELLYSFIVMFLRIDKIIYSVLDFVNCFICQ